MFTIERESFSELKSERTLFSSILSDYPEEKENSVMLTVKLNQIISNEGEEPVRGSMVLYYRKETINVSMIPGDIILFKCTPIPINNKGNPYEFDYKFYMESRGIKYYAFAGKEDILMVKSPQARKIKHKALIIRNKIISMYEKRGIRDERLALVSAITLGERSQLDPEQKQNFIKAGVMHIMAVSGLHAVILSLFIFNLLFFLKRRFNLIRVTVTILFLWAFAFVTGLTPSVLRATLMFSFLQAGNLMKRRVNGVNSVLASAFVLIIIRPSVIFDAGFLLSYSAVLFIIIFYRDLYQVLSFRYRFADLIWQSVAVTLVAQAGTLSLTIMLFNRFPVWFILTNVLIVPVSSLLIIIGSIVPLTFPFVPLSEFFAAILDKLTWLTEQITAKAASLPLSTIDNIGLSTPECILLTGAVSFTMYFILKKPRINILYPAAAFTLFSIFSILKKINVDHNNDLIVYNTPGQTTIGIKTGKILHIYSGSKIIPPEVIKHSSVMGLSIRRDSLSENPLLLKTGIRNIIISDSLNFKLPRQMTIDFLILTGRHPYISRRYPISDHRNTVFITTEASPTYRLLYTSADEARFRIWSVRLSGAYIQPL